MIQGKIESIAMYKTRFVILAGCSFFLSWGAGFNYQFGLPFSKIFVLFAFLSIFCWLIFDREKYNQYPLFFNLFILYIAVHTVVFYSLNLDLLFEESFSSLKKLGFSSYKELRFTRIIRVIYLILFGYSLIHLLFNKKSLFFLIYFLSFGFLFSFYGLNIHEAQLGCDLRFCGALLSPNGFASVAYTVMMLNLLSLFENKLPLWLKAISMAFIVISMLGIFLSSSRQVMLALAIAIPLLVLTVKTTKKRVVLLLLLLAVMLTSYILLPDVMTESLYNRSNADRIAQDKGSDRLEVYSDYSRHIEDYWLLGVGFKRSLSVVGDDFTSYAPKGTHNFLLSVLVQFGIIGLLLCVLGMTQFFIAFIKNNMDNLRTPQISVMLSFFIGWVVISLFRDLWEARDFWLSLAIFSFFMTSRDLDFYERNSICKKISS